MAKNILCLSGWGQKFDSLESIFDPIFFARSLNYSKFNDVQKFFTSIEQQKLNTEILVGWSLGGQLAIRLIEKQILQPKLLILIAPPFQMVKDQHIKVGMTKSTFDEFYQNFSKAPTRTLKKFSILTAMNDQNALEIARNLNINDDNFEQLKFWLEELGRFSCFKITFINMPRTIYFHGSGDMIVHVSQSEYFRERIENLRLEIFKNCGHAPHLNNPEHFREIILEEIASLKF